jgi:hypothetical protein
MGLIDRMLGVRKAPVFVPKENVVEIDHDEDLFTKSVRDAEKIARNYAGGSGDKRANIEVVILVRNDGEDWQVFEVFDSGRRTSGVRLPSKRYLYQVAKRAGKRYARSQKRATI